MPHLPLFPTPVSLYDLTGVDELNRELTTRLIAESKTVPSVHRSNVGSWHSPNLTGRPEACFRTFLQTVVIARVQETVEALAQERGQGLPPMRAGLHSWAMVMRNGDYTIPHDHSEVHWATVYYPDAGDADEKVDPASGLLALVDPRHGARQMPGLQLVGSTFTVIPRTGRLVVFPGWLLHYVHTYRGQRPRVSISTNVIFEPTGAVRERAQGWSGEHLLAPRPARPGRSIDGDLRQAGGSRPTTKESAMDRPPLPPFTLESATQKVRLAEDAWNTRDPARVALAYTIDSRWRNRAEFLQGREAIEAFLRRKWARELDYRLIKEIWAFRDNRIAVRFAYEWHDDSGSWFRSYGNENWEFDEHGLMRLRIASINDLPIKESERKYFWPLGRRPDDHASLSELGCSADPCGQGALTRRFTGTRPFCESMTYILTFGRVFSMASMYSRARVTSGDFWYSCSRARKRVVSPTASAMRCCL